MAVDRWRGQLERLLPGVALDASTVVAGAFHDVVLIPDVAAVRIARDADANEEAARQHELLTRLAELPLPFAVPQPLDEIRFIYGRPTLIVSWISGRQAAKGQGDPSTLRRLLMALSDVDIEPLRDVLAPPHAYAGGPRWPHLMLEEVVPRLPTSWRSMARERIENALALEPVEPRLVHGDLAGDNMRWDENGQLVGILDWDLAAAWDQAVDAACLSWHGWQTVRAAVDPETYRRAHTWYLTFGLEQVASALEQNQPRHDVEKRVHECVRWLGVTSEPWPDG